MKKSKGYKKIFEAILESQEYAQLEQYSRPGLWESLDLEEKELLSLLFVKQGEKQLAEGDNSVLESFRVANQIAPDNATILYRQAQAFTNQQHNQLCLKTAGKFFEMTVKARPGFFEAWHEWGNTLVLLGSMNHEPRLIQEALKKYAQAEKLADQVAQETLSCFYRDFGLCWYSGGKLSGEPFDFRNATQMYRKAARMGLSSHDFWNDYGNAITELAHLTNKPEMMIEAAEMYWKSVKISGSYSEGWFNLAAALKTLYEVNPQEAYYTFARESFEQLSSLDPHNFTVWLRWGELELEYGKNHRDPSRIEESCKKYEAAEVCEPNHPQILSAWGEAAMLIGAWNEDLDMLKNAMGKIAKSLDIQKDSPKAWGLYGRCLFELGKYYKDENYLQESIEKYDFGLRLDSDSPFLWHGMALTVFTLGQMRNDSRLVNEASSYCMQAAESGGKASPHLWNDWGLIQMKLAYMADDKKYLESAVNKFQQALRLRGKTNVNDPLISEWLYNLGCAYEFLGDYQESTSIYEKALQALKKVLEIDPLFYAAYFNIACTYCRLGELMADPEFFEQAGKYFHKAVHIDPEDDQAWNEWGVTLLSAAELTNDPARPDISRNYYVEAEKKLFQAAGLGNTSAMYHLACLYSLVENYDASICFLEKCREHASLPPLDDLLLDDWLENVRQTPRFMQLLSEIERSEF